VISAFYSSYVLAFIGLGLTFWGTLFVYIKFTKYVKLELLTAASSSSLSNIERILIATDTYEKGIYLPPKNLQDHASSLVFIPSEPNQTLPASVETTRRGFQSGPPAGLLITPPGLALSKLFEKHLGKSFTETKLEYLHTLLPKLLEELEITKNTTVQTEDNTVIIEMENHIFEALCEETKKLKRTHETVGCPLSSALACMLAKATGKPVTIEKEETTTDETTSLEYKILED
jgi:hypothetical protein